MFALLVGCFGARWFGGFSWVVPWLSIVGLVGVRLVDWSVFCVRFGLFFWFGWCSGWRCVVGFAGFVGFSYGLAKACCTL